MSFCAALMIRWRVSVEDSMGAIVVDWSVKVKGGTIPVLLAGRMGVLVQSCKDR
jgi:hypothetical protein